MTNFLKVAGKMEKSFFRMAGKMLKFIFELVRAGKLKFSFSSVPGVEKLFFNRPANSSEFVKFYIAGGYDNFFKNFDIYEGVSGKIFELEEVKPENKIFYFDNPTDPVGRN